MQLGDKTMIHFVVMTIRNQDTGHKCMKLCNENIKMLQSKHL